MLLEVEYYYGTLVFLTALLVAAIFSFTKQPQLHLPPSPFALPIIGHLHLLGPIIHHSFHKLSTRFGPLIYLKLGSIPCVVASTPELASELLKTNELTFSSRKHTLAIDHLTYNGSSFAFAPYGPYWKFIKKEIMTKLIGNRILNGFLQLRTEEYHRFLRVIMQKSRSGETVNVTQELLKLTNNVICQMTLSIRCSDTDGQAEEARTIVREVTRIFGEFNLSDNIWFLRNFDMQGFRKRFEEIHMRYDALLEKIMTEREDKRKKRREQRETMCSDEVGEGDDVKDFLDTLLDAMEDEISEIKITRDHIKALVLDLFTAATDTTAIALEWALAELINNPVVLQKARDEIEQVVGKDRLVKESDSLNLPYIQAIIKETFRLHPPIPMISRKSTMACNISNYVIPKNTLLFVNIWSIGRDPKYWENPLKFLPERFLGQPSCEGNAIMRELVDVKGQHFQLLPFGTGRRGCPGMTLAMQELPTILASIIQCFELKVVSSKVEKMNGDHHEVVDMTERSGLTAPRVDDLVCVPIARFCPNILDS